MDRELLVHNIKEVLRQRLFEFIRDIGQEHVILKGRVYNEQELKYRPFQNCIDNTMNAINRLTNNNNTFIYERRRNDLKSYLSEMYNTLYDEFTDIAEILANRVVDQIENA